MWVGLSSFHALKLLALQSTANVQKAGTELGGAGHVNARHGWGGDLVTHSMGAADTQNKYHDCVYGLYII